MLIILQNVFLNPVLSSKSIRDVHLLMFQIVPQKHALKEHGTKAKNSKVQKFILKEPEAQKTNLRVMSF